MPTLLHSVKVWLKFQFYLKSSQQAVYLQFIVLPMVSFFMSQSLKNGNSFNTQKPLKVNQVKFWKNYVKTYVFSGEHLEQLLLRAGFCLEPWHLIANLSSSAISEHKLWWSICEFFLEFQQNSKTATTIATAKPHNNTTNTPPMFFTLNGLAFESLLLSWNKNNDKMSLFYSRFSYFSGIPLKTLDMCKSSELQWVIIIFTLFYVCILFLTKHLPFSLHLLCSNIKLYQYVEISRLVTNHRFQIHFWVFSRIQQN